jgi:hypothetical protein
MIPLYFREDNGDYLVVFLVPTIRDPFENRMFEGRAADVAGLHSSVCSCRIHIRHIRTKCEWVHCNDVPAAWMEALSPAEEPASCE